MYERERESRKRHQPLPHGPKNIHSMRVANLENLLKATEETGASAKVNSLKQVIRRNKIGMAQDARTSMDLMREIFQSEITKEIYQILDRHARTTFSPAIENLRRNGHAVDDAVMSELFTNILESAKSSFAMDNGLPAENFQKTLPSYILHHTQAHPMPDIQNNRPTGQLPQPITVIPPQPHIPQQFPSKEERFHMDMSPLNPLDVSKWNPERFGLPTLLISTAKVATHMGLTVTSFFGNFPRIFRYTCDEHDRRALVEEGRLRDPEASRVYLLCLEDVREITANVQEIEPFAFCAKETLVLKIRRYAQPYFERLLLRQKQAQIQQWQQLEQQRQ